MKPTSNKIICDLNKVQWALTGWRNQYGQLVPAKPRYPTVNGLNFDAEAKHLTEPMTMLEYAIKYCLLDQWTPYVKLQFSANHCLVYTGDKATEIIKAYSAKIFGKQQRRKR